MKGFVPTPHALVDLMVAKLFRRRTPTAGSRVLDPGCGTGEFIDGVLRACAANRWPVPHIVGVELDPVRAATAEARFAHLPEVVIRREDYLLDHHDSYDFIVGNPPYVSILGLSAEERAICRSRYATAVGRFDLYVLFFEQALRQLKQGGTLVFVTPEKFLYVETTRELRRQLSEHAVTELHFLEESAFPDLVTYPLVTTVHAASRPRGTAVISRSGERRIAHLSGDASWQPAVQGYGELHENSLCLADVCRRVSCGVATGADNVFVVRSHLLPLELAPFAHSTVSGRQISAGGQVTVSAVMLAPYDDDGVLLPEDQLGALGDFLSADARRSTLLRRTCARSKPWYAFHDSFPIHDMRRPKLLCKDITATPHFVADPEGAIVPRHSVYYAVPGDPSLLTPLQDYLNSDTAAAWLRAHCQRAAKDFLRMQSAVLKRLPIPRAILEPAVHAGAGSRISA